MPRHRPLGVHQLNADRRVDRLDHGRSGDAPQGGPQGRRAVALGGPAERAAQVVAKAQRGHACRQRHSLAAARAAGRPGGVPRVSGGAVQRVVSVPAEGEVRQVGPGHRNRARLAQVGHLWRIEAGIRVYQRGNAVRGG